MAIINDEMIYAALEKPVNTAPSHIREILEKARLMKGISFDEVVALLRVEEREILAEIYETARYIKQSIYGNRLVLFAPLYISNLCNNECLYCAFRSSNKSLKRKVLSQEEIAEEVEILLNQGHKRVLLVAGESYPREGFDYVINSIRTVYDVKTPKGNVRRQNVNVAPLSVEEFKRLHQTDIGTYQIFQETYHTETYHKMHLKGPKANYQYRLEAIDRAFEAGFDDVGIGILFGLADWKYEILAMLSHINHLEEKFGVGPHTISVPRIEPALGSDVSYHPPFALSDDEFKKIIAVLRIAVPYTGIILSTRENAQMRRDAFALGVSQISAGSRTNPGGYKHSDLENPEIPEGERSQFSLGDTRSLIEVTKDIIAHGQIPSYCTACYRLGRVGKDFMDLAKPGLIKAHCLPNAIFTFAEYLEDFGDEDLKQTGFELIEKMIQDDISGDALKQKVMASLEAVKNGKRDIFV